MKLMYQIVVGFFLSGAVTGPTYAQALDYDFGEVLTLANDSCEQGENCLLAPYIAVALFSDRNIDGRQVGVLLQDYFYCHEPTGNIYRAPVGLETDFLSIPDLAQFAIRPKDFLEASVIHDWLYAVGEADRREHADDVFHDMLKEQGADIARRNVMYRAVRWFGKPNYGASEEIKIVDLETMEHISPSPVSRPEISALINIDCTDKEKFDEVRASMKSTYAYQVKTNELFEHDGFERTDD